MAAFSAVHSTSSSGEHPDFNSMTVAAAMEWVNEKKGDERSERMARVLAHVRPDNADTATVPPVDRRRA